MLLTLDVGNSAIKGGLFDSRELRHVFSISTDTILEANRSSGAAWQDALTSHLNGPSINRVGLASVVPAIADGITAAVSEHMDAPLTRVHPSMPLPFELDYDTPETLGTDRLAAAAAGWELFGTAENPPRSVIVVDAGTAVTCEVVHRDGIYHGGTISAGPELLRDALQSGTAQLPQVPLQLPDSPVGRSTQTAIQSGIMWGLIDGVRGMVDRVTTALPDAPRIVLTGGWGPLLTDHIDAGHHDPHLVLRGIQVLVSEGRS